jgi:predicted transcriptional regulator
MSENDLGDNELLTLKNNFYDPLCDSLREDNKLKNKSLILRLFNITPNNILPYIVASSVPYEKVEKNILNSLKEKKVIKNSYKPNEYMITPKGIWVIETSLGVVSTDQILEYLEDKFFYVDRAKLKSKEKVVLLSLIAIRAFYEKTPLNRNNGNVSQEKLFAILEESKNFLIKMGTIQDFSLGYSREDPLESVFRRLDELKNKTGNLYQFNKGKIWLSLYNETSNKIAENNLSYLLWRIFGGNLSYMQQKEVAEFCNKILRENKNYVFNDEEYDHHVFSKADFENVVIDALYAIHTLKVNWEN